MLLDELFLYPLCGHVMSENTGVLRLDDDDDDDDEVTTFTLCGVCGSAQDDKQDC
jgi:hypothetical protein